MDDDDPTPGSPVQGEKSKRPPLLEIENESPDPKAKSYSIFDIAKSQKRKETATEKVVLKRSRIKATFSWCEQIPIGKYYKNLANI